MFFVTLLLENVLTWVRRQSGTTSLRALLYIDEIFGYFPPSAEPPSKRPLLTLLKQARAFGVGLVLVTQNPVDLDYKGLTNAGTWFIGKLQAERDKARVLEGLQGAIAESGGNRDVDYDRIITQLSSRVFLLHNVHADRPVVFQTRWAMSYLRGPLTRPQVRELMADRLAAMNTPTPPVRLPAAIPSPIPAPPPAAPARLPTTAGESEAPDGFSAAVPTLDPDVMQVYLPLVTSDQVALRYLVQETKLNIRPERVQLVYEAAILSQATVRFADRKRQLDESLPKLCLAPAPVGLERVDWSLAEELGLATRDLRQTPERVLTEQGPFFSPVPEAVNSTRELNGIKKDLADWLYYNSRLTIQAHSELGLYQAPRERERDFKIRLQQAARERRDAEVDQVAEAVERQMSRLEEKLRKHERTLAADEADYTARKQQEWVGIGESVLSWVLGRRNSRVLSTAASRRRLTAQAGQELEESREEITDLQEAITQLEAQLKAQTAEITLKWDNLLTDLSQETLTPRRTDVDVKLVALAWLPSWVIRYNDGQRLRTDTIAAYQLPAVG